MLPDRQTSKAFRDLVTQLLAVQPAARLGAQHGAVELKRHPFFKPVHWALLASQRVRARRGRTG